MSLRNSGAIVDDVEASSWRAGATGVSRRRCPSPCGLDVARGERRSNEARQRGQ
jgi:hypothetical protein